MRRYLWIWLVLSIVAGCNCSNKKQPVGDPCAGKDLSADVLNCGACGNACAASQTCSAGACQAPDPCAGKNLQTDPQNCGVCGHACAASQTCSSGACQTPDPCAGKNLQTDPQNCGTCGHACPAGDSCQTGMCLAPTPPPLAVAITSPAEGAHVLPRFTVAAAVTATGAVDSLAVQAGSATPVALTPGATASGALDLSSLADGQTVALVAHVAQGTRTADSAAVHVVIDRAPLRPQVTAGFYKASEAVTLRASLPAATPAIRVDFALAGAGAPIASVTSGSAGTWQAPLAPQALGAGDNSITATAFDAAGNSVKSAAATITVGLLHGTGTGSANVTVLAVDSPSAHGLLWKANDLGGTPDLGELRYAATGGGAELALGENVCFETGVSNSALSNLTGLLSADGSALAFPASSTGTCNLLYFTRLPATAAPAQLSATYQSSTVMLSLDGSVIAWLETSAGSLVLKGGSAGGAATQLDIGDVSAGRISSYPLNGALLLNARTAGDAPSTVSYRLTAAGLEALKLSGADVALPNANTGGLYNGSEQDNGGAAGPNLNQTSQTAADGSAVLVNTPGGMVSIKAAAGSAPSLVCAANTCTDFWQMSGGRFNYQKSNTPGNPGTNQWNLEFLDAATGVGAEVPGASGYQVQGSLGYFNPVVPRDNSLQAYVTGANPYAAGLLLASDPAHPIPLAGGFGDQVTINFFNWLSGQAYQIGNYDSGFLYFRQNLTSFDDPAHALLFDAGQLWGVRVGKSPPAVRLDSAANPFQSNLSKLFLSTDHKHAYWRANTSQLYSWQVDAAASVNLSNAAVALPKGPSSWPALAASDEASNTMIAYSDNTTGALAVQPFDGGAATPLNDNVDRAALRYGITLDEIAWWYAADGHLRAKALSSGGGPADFGAVNNPNLIIALQGGAFLFNDTATNTLQFATLAQPAPVTLGSAAGGYARPGLVEGLAIDDDSKGAYVREPGGRVFWVTASAAPKLLVGSANAVVDPRFDALTGTASALDGTTGALWFGGLRQGAGAPVQAEAGGVTAVLNAGGHSIPAATGALLMEPEFTQAAGPRFRWAVVYKVGGTDRPGLYLWDVVDGLGD